jgi:molybdenum cofactor cytidylyltransferase
MVSAILLAAGESKRMGKLKQLLPLGNTTVLGRAIDNLTASKIEDIIVVLGYAAEDVEKRIEDRPVRIAINPDYRLGMSSSIKVGVEALHEGAEAVMLALADQPFIDSGTIDHFINESQKGEKGIIIPTYRGRRGHPVIFSIKYRNELMALEGDVGARDIILTNPGDILELPVDCEGVIIDIDTAEDYCINSND